MPCGVTVSAIVSSTCFRDELDIHPAVDGRLCDVGEYARAQSESP